MALSLVLTGCSSSGTGLDEDVRVLPGVPDNYGELMADRAEMLGLENPPKVAPIRVVTRDEYYAVQQSCLAELGFQTEVAPDADGLTLELADGQFEAYSIADYTCSGQYPLHKAYREELSEEQLQVYFDWNRGVVSACMSELGHQPSEPPSFPVFVEEYRAGRGMWVPFDNVPEAFFTETMTELSKHCELEPKDEAVFTSVG